jgi:hypothetical protein
MINNGTAFLTVQIIYWWNFYFTKAKEETGLVKLSGHQATGLLI